MSMKSQLGQAQLHRSSRQQQAQQQGGERLAPYRFKPGQSGNPGGRKKNLARIISQNIFELNEAAIYKAQGKRILKGDPYAYTQHADRAYGKLKETVEHTADDALIERLLAGRKRAAERNRAKRDELANHSGSSSSGSSGD